MPRCVANGVAALELGRDRRGKIQNNINKSV
jgi:hypothetical protein